MSIYEYTYLLSTEGVLCGSVAFYFNKVMSGTEYVGPCGLALKPSAPATT